MAWAAKGIVGPPPSILHAFYIMTLQHAHVVSILKHTIIIVEGSSRLDILSKGPPLSSFARKGSRLDVPLWFTLLGGSFVFLHVV
jgi:hypothetical protein